MSIPEDDALPAAATQVPAGKLDRRSVLNRIGATSLVAAAGIFAGVAKANKASASPDGPMCCDLANDPPNATWDYCQAHAQYTWYCADEGSLSCGCCETAGYAQSAYECSY